MLAARGVSLGLGRDINLSGLNQLSAADKALLGRIDRKKKASQQQKPKYIIKKHVDTKTLWIACVTLIVGSSVMLLGLLATIAGYFDEEIGSGVFDLPSPIRADGEPEDASKITTLNRTAWLLLQSLQYIGPIFMGIGLFSLIMACVLTLESRDRHTIIERSSDVNKIGTRISKGSSNTHRTKTPFDVNNFQTVYIAEDKEKLTEDYYKSTAADDTISASAASVMPNGVSSKKRNLANGETPDTKNISEKDHPEISIEIDATEECSSTSRKSHSKFFGRISKPHLLGENSEQCNKFDVVPPQIDQQSNDRCAVYVEKSVRMKSSDTIATGLGEGGGPPMATVKRLNPRGLAPIVHADSLIELSTSGPSAGASPKL